LRILWQSNAPWANTGYGNQTDLFVPRIRDLGHDTAILAFFGLQGGPLEWNRMPVYPCGMDPWGNDVAAAWASHWFGEDPRAGVVITLQDVWTLHSDALAYVNMASWVPVDHAPVPPPVVGFFQHYPGTVPIAMSRFGQAELAKQIDDEILYVPHGVDTQVFSPRADRDEIRGFLGIPSDAFVVGMVAANKGIAPSRKAFPEVFLAFAEFKRSHPDALLYMHTLRTEGHAGLNLQFLARSCGVSESDIVWVDQLSYMLGDIPGDKMAALYSVMDVLANPSYGEGFGIPILEAQACGVPVIVGDNTAMPEILGGGWKVECEPFWEERAKSFFFRPKVPAIVDAMQRAYRAGRKPAKLAREHALRFDADRVLTEHWVPALEHLSERLAQQRPSAEPVDISKLAAAVAPSA